MTVVFLIDKTAVYAHVESDLPQIALDAIGASVQDFGWIAGDRLYAAWIQPGSPALGDAVVSPRVVAEVPRRTFDPLPTIAPAVSQVECRHFCEVSVPEYDAKLKEWRANQLGKVAEYRANQQRAVQTFRLQVATALSVVRPTPLAATAPDISGALYGASLLFDGAPNPSLKKLVVFSALIESSTPSHAAFKLDGVEVLIHGYHRHGAEFQQEGQVQWRQRFEQLGARVRAFVPENAVAPQDIPKFLQEGR